MRDLEDIQYLAHNKVGHILYRLRLKVVGDGDKDGRILLAARRGGVEVKEALHELDKAVDSQIELEVLVHGFSAEAGSAFREKQAEGIGHAEAALQAGHAAMNELGNRRRGLGISLIFILLTLIGLGIKIRQTPVS